MTKKKYQKKNKQLGIINKVYEGFKNRQKIDQKSKEQNLGC